MRPMANKTPGQLAYHGMTLALRWRPCSWEQLTDDQREGVEAAAQAVREQLRRELDAEIGIAAAEPSKFNRLLGEIAVGNIARVRDIRRVLAEWSSNHAKVMSKWVYFNANDVIEAIEDIVAEPKPESAEVGKHGE